MTEDQILRLLLCVLAAFFYWNHHVMHKKRATKPWRTPENVIEAMVVITPTLWTLSLVLFVLGVKWFDYSHYVPSIVRWFGLVLMVGCYPLSMWIYKTLGEYFSQKLELREEHRLIDFGPYQYVRHPMYVTLFVCAIATCLISADLGVLITTLAVAAVMLLRIRREERMLVHRFGVAYEAYQATTGALIPRLSSIMR